MEKKTGGILDGYEPKKVRCETTRDEKDPGPDTVLLGDDFGLGLVEETEAARTKRMTDALLDAASKVRDRPRLPDARDTHSGPDLTAYVSPPRRSPGSTDQRQPRKDADIGPLKEYLLARSDQGNADGIKRCLMIASRVLSRMRSNGLFVHAPGSECMVDGIIEDLTALVAPTWQPAHIEALSLSSIFPRHRLFDDAAYVRILDRALDEVVAPLSMLMPEKTGPRKDNGLVPAFQAALGDFHRNAPLPYKCSLDDLLLMAAVSAYHALPVLPTYLKALEHCARGAVPIGQLRGDRSALVVLIA